MWLFWFNWTSIFNQFEKTWGWPWRSSEQANETARISTMNFPLLCSVSVCTIIVYYIKKVHQIMRLFMFWQGLGSLFGMALFSRSLGMPHFHEISRLQLSYSFCSAVLSQQLRVQFGNFEKRTNLKRWHIML